MQRKKNRFMNARPVFSISRENERYDCNNMEKFHCVSCGRFLGYQKIVEGMCAVYCNKCKNTTIVMPDVKTE